MKTLTDFWITFGTNVLRFSSLATRWPLGVAHLGCLIWGVSFYVTRGHPFHSAGLSVFQGDDVGDDVACWWRIVDEARGWEAKPSSCLSSSRHGLGPSYVSRSLNLYVINFHVSFKSALKFRVEEMFHE